MKSEYNRESPASHDRQSLHPPLPRQRAEHRDVEWSDGSRTEGAAERYHGMLIPSGEHMGALFDHALRDGLTIGKEVW